MTESVFDTFNFDPVDYNPFEANPVKVQPSRPYSPTPGPLDTIFNQLQPEDLQDLPAHWAQPAPLPSWLPPNVQNYINQAPSYEEGERMSPFPSNMAGGEPYSPTPQIDDIQRLFHGRVMQNAPTGSKHGFTADQYRNLMKLPGFSGFTGGDEI